MMKIDDRYWIETGSFVRSSIPKKSTTNNGTKGTSYPYVHAPHAQNPYNPSLSRFEVFPNAQTFCGKLEPLYSTQYSNLFVTYTEGFDMHTEQPNPSSMINEYFSDTIVLNNSNNNYVFPALNVSNNFATIDYDAHINTKTDYTINHVFRSMTVQELNIFHTVWELERNQRLTILAKSVQNPEIAGFLLTGNRSNFLYVEGSAAWFYDCPHFPLHYTSLIVVLTESLFTLKTPLCTLILLPAKHLIMRLLSHVIKTQKTILNLTPTQMIKTFMNLVLNLLN